MVARLVYRHILRQNILKSYMSSRHANLCIFISLKCYVKHFQVDEILKDIPDGSGGKKDIKVLRLPTKHCFFNPIELVWAYVKGYVARKNHSCKLKETESLTREALEQVRDIFVSQVS